VGEPNAQLIPQQATQYKPRILATSLNNPIPTIHVAHQQPTMLKIMEPYSMSNDDLPQGFKRNIASAQGVIKVFSTFDNVRIKQSCTPQGMTKSTMNISPAI